MQSSMVKNHIHYFSLMSPEGWINCWLECDSRKSRYTWSNRQVWPWSTKWSRAKTNSFVKRIHWSKQTPFSNNTRGDFTCGHHQTVNTEIRLVMFFAAKEGEALHSQQKQDEELTVTQNINSLLQISGLNQGIQVWPKSNPLMLIQWR